MGLQYVPSIETGLDVDLGRYRTFREGQYVELLCALPAEQIKS